MHEEFLPKDIEGKFAHLVEELGEATQAAGKILRFGPYSVNPLLPKEQQIMNEDKLLLELGDLSRAAQAYVEAVQQARSQDSSWAVEGTH